MKFKHQLALFNALTRLLVILLLWLLLPVLVERVVQRHLDRTLAEKKQNFIAHLDKKEINDYLVRRDSGETFSSYSTLHSEFLQLSRLSHLPSGQTFFLSEARIIEDEQNDYRVLRYEFEYEQTAYLLEIGSSLSEVEELIFAIRVFILIVLVVILIATFLLDTFFIEYLLKPFYRIIETKIKRVNQPDRFDHTPIAGASADFQQLDTVLNQMMDRMTAIFEKERQFIGNVSHEMLTPIALLQHKFENLLQNDSLNDEAVDKMAGALKTLDRLKKVINNLLLISRIDNHQYEANEPIEFEEIFENLAQDFDDRLADRQIQLDIALLHAFDYIGNRTLMHILWHNLFLNAIKYNRTGGSITITDGHSGDRHFIAITDTGIGMDELQVANIFGRFTRFGAEQEGQGLGLAIAMSVAQFHNIDIEVFSAVGKGTTFRLLF